MMDRRLLGMLALVSLAACSGGGGGGSAPTSGTPTLSVAMVDAPFAMSGATVTAVDLGIDKVEVVGTSGPVVIKDYGATPNVVNILDYTSASAPLQFPSATIAAGSYQQIRFVLDSATTTIAYTDASGAHTSPLTVPSGTSGGFGNGSSTDSGDGQGTSGFKVNIALDASGNATYGYILDFNAAQSIVMTGNGKFILKPVIVATAVQTSGAIAGTVVNMATPGVAVVGAEVDAVVGATTINSGVTATDGTFTINALPVGSYTLVVKNSGTTLGGSAFTATNYDTSVGAMLAVPGPFAVTAGSTTSAGTIKD